MLNEDKLICYEKSKIDLSFYFTEDNMSYYSCKESKFKSNIKCFSLIPQQIITLTFLQVQIVNNKLVCYMITNSPLPKNLSIKLKIVIYQIRLRNLEISQEEVILSTQEDFSGNKNSIISFIFRKRI